MKKTLQINSNTENTNESKKKKKRRNERIVDWTQERNGKTVDIIAEIETKLQSA